MEEEVWKDVVGYEGIYQVSSWGRIKALERTVSCHKVHTKVLKEKFLIRSLMNNGYYSFAAYKNGKMKRLLIHRCVAEAFLDNPNGKKCVDHIDGDRKNCHVNNLRWATHKENTNNPNTRSNMKCLIPELPIESLKRLRANSVKAHEKAVVRLDENKNFICEYESVRKASKAMGYYQEALIYHPTLSRVAITAGYN